jgi:hypothetical protein
MAQITRIIIIKIIKHKKELPEKGLLFYFGLTAPAGPSGGNFWQAANSFPPERQ